MFSRRKAAKEFICNATKTEYNAIVDEAFLTLRQREILFMKRNDAQISNWKISVSLNVSVDTVNQEFCRIYDKIAKIL